jgi:D-3-phosphoglycerate dehydrogenase / 2-oxoglutarate reductase
VPLVTITDNTFPALDIEEDILKPMGFEVRAGQWKTPASLAPQVADADAIITQFATVNAEVIAAMARAKVIVRYGIGVDNVDLDAAKARGIPVCNVPDYCIDEVADHTLAMLLAITRQVVANSVHIRDGNWGLATPMDNMRALKKLTVGIVGFGRIGREVVARLRSFKCPVLVFDPIVELVEIERSGATPVTFDELLAKSDAVSLHCPSTPKTRGLINHVSLSQMKRGSILVNVARGDLVDSAALTEALQSGQLSAAALDVFAPEPIPADHPIRTMGNVVLASHIASCSVPAVRKLRETAAHLAAMAIRGERLPSVVNGVSQP